MHGQKDLIVFSLLVLGLFLGARIWARASLSKIRSRLIVDKERLFPDEKLTLTVHAENKKFLPIWLRTEVPISRHLYPSSGEERCICQDQLWWYQGARFEYEFIARRRGVHQIGPLHLMAGDLFDFFVRERREEAFHQVIVYPKILPLKSFPLPRRDFFGVPGAESPVQDPISILGTRDYQHGQPANYIHWKASARHHRLQEKVFEPTEQEKVLLVVDVDQFASSKAEEEFETILEIVASLAVMMDRRGYALGLATNGIVVGGNSTIVPIRRNRQQLPAILEVLARLRMESRGDLLDVVGRGLEIYWGMSCLHFSYQEDGTIETVQHYFKHPKTPVIFFVCRPRLAAGEKRTEAWYKVYSISDMVVKQSGKV